MRLDARAFGIAAGATAAVLFAICSLAVAVAPEPTTAFFGYLIHMDLSQLPRTLTLASFIGGLIAWTLGTGLTFWFAASIYNRLIATSVAAPVAASQPPVGQRA